MPHPLTTTVAQVLDGSGVEATEHSLISFFVDNVNSFGGFKWGTYRRYRNKFIGKDIYYSQLKRIVDSNYLYLKDRVLSLKAMNSSNITFTENEHLKVSVLNYLKSCMNNKSRRLKYGSIAAASREFKIPSEEIKRMWKVYLKLQKKRNANNTDHENNDLQDEVSTMSSVDEKSSPPKTIATQGEGERSWQLYLF